jgi:hypothetical protein
LLQSRADPLGRLRFTPNPAKKILVNPVCVLKEGIVSGGGSFFANYRSHYYDYYIINKFYVYKY